jgi:predicted regulator of Ras-like GTPase activity (Roadblock/LC7/MglB family)
MSITFDGLIGFETEKIMEKIEQILKQVSKKIQFIVVVDKNGLPIASFDTTTNKNIDPEKEIMVAGIAAAVLNLGESTATILDHGLLKQVIIKNEEGTTVILSAGEVALLIATMPARVGIVSPLISLQLIANKIAKLKGLPGQSSSGPDDASDIFIPEID